MDGYSLALYSPILQGQAPQGDITGLAKGWRRSVRRQGGFWTGSWYNEDEPLDVLQDIFYTLFMGHIVEKAAGGVTWEGFIGEMDLDDDPERPKLDVSVFGYIFTGNDRYLSGLGGGSMANANVWLQSIIENRCDFLNAGKLVENTLGGFT
jgi:hypothetical protein